MDVKRNLVFLNLAVCVVAALELCPTGWLQYKDKCYLSVTEKMTYIAARSYCRDQNSGLLSIHSQEENDFWRSVNGGEWWFGLNDMGFEGNFKWEDGTALDFTSWYGAEPNDVGGEDCGGVNADLGWNDFDCDTLLDFICIKARAGKCGKYYWVENGRVADSGLLQENKTVPDKYQCAELCLSNHSPCLAFSYKTNECRLSQNSTHIEVDPEAEVYQMA